MDYRLDIDGWMTEEELQWLHELATQVSSIAEIGCWKGRSTFALLSGCRGPVYAIDHWRGSIDELDSTHREARESDIYGQFWANVGHFQNLNTVKQSSLSASQIVPEVDMVFIDGGHRYVDVISDLMAWRPKALRIICGHDFDFDEVELAVLEVFGTVQRGPGSIWYFLINSVDGDKSMSDRPALAVCLPGSNFSGKWLAAWNELYSHLQVDFRVTCVYGEGNNIYEVRKDCVARLGNMGWAQHKPQLVLWIDSDNIVSYSGFKSLLVSITSVLEASMVGAWYMMQMHHGEQPMVTAGTGDERPSIQTIRHGAGRLLEVEYIGLGFLLMKYSLLEELGLHCFNPILREDGDFETDDVSFCLRAREKGHKIFLSTAVHSPHLKLMPVPMATRGGEPSRIVTPLNEGAPVS